MHYTEASLKKMIREFIGDFSVYVIKDKKLKIYYFSEDIPSISGYSKKEYEEITKGDACDIIVPEDREHVMTYVPDLMRAGAKADVTYRIKHKDKGFVWIRARAKCFGDLDGDPLVYTQFFDATKETDGFANLMDFADNIVYVCDRKTWEMYYANEKAFEHWGHRDFGGKKCFEFTRGRKEPCPWCSIYQMEDGHYSNDAAFDPERNKYYHINCDDVMWYGREAVATFAMDVTDKVSKVAHLESEKDAVDSIVASMPTGVVVYRLDGDAISFVTANARAYDEFEVENKKEYMEDQHAFEKRVHPDDIESVLAAMRSMREPDHEFQYVYRYYMSNGEYKWLKNRVRTLLQEDGSVMVFSVIIDVTAEKETEMKLKQSNKMYESAADLAELAVWIYDIKKHSITMSQKSADKEVSVSYNIPKVIENVPESILKWIDDRYKQKLLDVYAKIDGGASSASCEYWYKTIPGVRPRYYSIEYNTVFDAYGKPEYAYGIGIDRTTEKLKEEQFGSLYKQLIKVNPYSLGSYRLNLTTNWCGEAQSPLQSVIDQESSATADGFLKANADIICDTGIKKKYIRMFNRKHLIEEFRSDNKKIMMTYPVRSSKGDQL